MKAGKNRQPRTRIFWYATASLLSLALITGCSAGRGATATGLSPQPAPAGQLKQTSINASLPRAPRGEQPAAGLGAPLTLFTLKNFIGSGRCAFCHTLLVDREGHDMSISNHWRSTMMANAAKDPFWQAKVASETGRNPAVRQVIEEKCVTCHMPMAWTQFNANAGGPGYGSAATATPFADFLNPANPLHEAALDGVSCSLCHQIEDQGLGTKKSFSGKFNIDTGTKAPDRLIFGPYEENVPEPMQTGIGFTPIYGPHTNDSALCASCHTLYTPYLDATGRIAGELPEQTAYLEWQHSDYGEKPGDRHRISETVDTVRLCQECHMPHSPSGGVMIGRPAPPAATAKDHFSQHFFVGGNLLLPAILENHLTELAVSASTAKIDDTMARAADLLQQQSATLTIVDSAASRDTLSVTLAVENLAGHKFPTGFPSRRAWLHVIAVDAAGATIFESGAVAANGKIIGDDGDEQLRFEPHYERITQPDQVQIYESVMQNAEGEVTRTLLRGARYIKDNRLLPKGFDKRTAAADIAVRGEAAADPNFIGGSDQVSYQMPLNNHQGPFTVTAELLYATASAGFMEDLARDASQPLVGRFLRFYDQTDKRPVTVAAVRGLIR